MNIAVFSLGWILLFVLIAAIVLALRPLAKKSRPQRRTVMLVMSIFVFAYWLAYKVGLYLEPGYEFRFWDELPLHLCNITAIISIVAVASNRKILLGFCFYVGTLGALMAMFLPDSNFTGVAFSSAKGWGYWGFHALLIAQSISLAVTGLYRPEYDEIPRILGVVMLVAAAMHVVNLFMRATVFPEANYFYTFGIPGNPLTDLLQKLIPTNLLFLMPMVLPVGLVCAGMAWLVRRTALKEQRDE